MLDTPVYSQEGVELSPSKGKQISVLLAGPAAPLHETAPFLTILTLPLTFNISYGIGFGFIFYVLIKLARGKPGEVHSLLYGAAALFALAFVVSGL